MGLAQNINARQLIISKILITDINIESVESFTIMKLVESISFMIKPLQRELIKTLQANYYLAYKTKTVRASLATKNKRERTQTLTL